MAWAYRGEKTAWHWGKNILINAGQPDEAVGFTTTMVLGPVVLHIFGHDYPRDDFTIQLNGDRAQMAEPIWPLRTSAFWPPPKVMNEDNLWRFAQMFEAVGELRRLRVKK